MATSLQGKILTVLGGNGYVGSSICRNAVILGAKVNSISRSGIPNTQAPWTTRVNWIKGDAMYPESFEKVLHESDSVIHSLGVLFDTSYTQFKKPGDDGTYEQINRDTAKAIGQKLSDFKSDKKIIYISSAHSIPIAPRYLQTKIEAEEFLFKLPSIRTIVLRPGFIYDSQGKPWTIPVKYGVDTYAAIYKVVSSMTPNNSLAQNIIKHFDVDYSIDLDSVAISAIVASFDSKYDGRILNNEDMQSIKKSYDMNGLNIPVQEHKNPKQNQQQPDNTTATTNTTASTTDTVGTINNPFQINDPNINDTNNPLNSSNNRPSNRL